MRVRAPRQRQDADGFSAKSRKKRAKRGGAKDYMPDGSRKQNEAIDAARDAMFTLLREEESRKTSAHAAQGRLDRSTGLTTITRAKGTHLHVMGHTVSGGQLALYPEEALWLMSMRLLEVRDQANVPCSLQDYYQLVFAGHDRWINFEKYQVSKSKRTRIVFLLNFLALCRCTHTFDDWDTLYNDTKGNRTHHQIMLLVHPIMDGGVVG